MANQIYRLSEARELRGLTVAELAEKIGVSRQAVYKYESGTQSPHRETFEAICSILNFPESFFLAPHTSVSLEDRPIYFRDMKTNLSKYRKMSARWLSLLYDRVHVYEEYVQLPEVRIPSLDISDFTALSNEDIDICAEDTRRHWGLGDGPISDLTLLLENNGFIICRKETGSEKLDACSAIIDGRPYILCNTQRLTCSRVLANLAHELGHIILHQAVDKESMQKKETHELMERQAWRFASSFLMPPAVFTAEVGYPSLQRFETLKKRWRTSIASMIMHCRALDLFGDDKKQYFFRELSRSGHRKSEPLDDTLLIENPRLLFECEKLISSSNPSLKDIFFQKSCLNEEDYTDLISAPSDYLSVHRQKPALRLI